MSSSADRSFATLVAVSVLPYAVVLGAGCGLIWQLRADVADAGFASLRSTSLLPVLVVLLLAAGAGAALRSVVVQLRASVELAGLVRAARCPEPDRAQRGVIVIDRVEPFAFVAGLRTPRVVVSRGLLEQLSPAEADAVVAHERCHQRSRDPLKLVVARGATAAGFFVPVARHLSARYVARRELAADRFAVQAHGCAALAGALCKTVPGPGWDALRAGTALSSPELLALRVEQLERGVEPPLPPLPVSVLSTSAGVLALLGAVIVAASVRMGVVMCTLDMAGSAPLGVGVGVLAAVGCAGLWVWVTLVAVHPLTTPELCGAEP